ncbi:V-set and immunoglobulin domain-containing protein 10-like [Lytechinus variegatus]|uniref:V-set and immunoglobulin domain-containing protein 10-like n=1 Tax=Lytechinus variegatus TaxID=7654 RepID=UPI001BB22309|nr:V-set and immunoglobulin domain-containing protein 10-like [Lytechinus variegatus]
MGFGWTTHVHGQVTPPPSTVVALGDDVSLTCTSTESNPTFTWTFLSDDVQSQLLFYGDSDSAIAPRYDNIVLRSSPNVHTSILGINTIQLEDEGRYQCSTTTTLTPPVATVVFVEVGSASQPICLESPHGYTKYIATCEAIGSKPGENITWILDGVIQTDGIAQTGTTGRGDSLFDTTSVFTFLATVGNYNATLGCIIGGHQVNKLNRQETRLVDIQNPPKARGITIDLNSDGTDLTVSCEINNDVDEAIPPMESFCIYSNGSLVTKPVSANSVTVSEPDYDTEYMCVGGNYLGNTSASETFYPGRTNWQTATVTGNSPAAAGTDVTLTCDITGGTPSTILWVDDSISPPDNFFSGTAPFSSSAKFNNFDVTTLTATQSVMTISSVEVTDDGIYRCDVVGTDSSIDFVVEAAPTMTLTVISELKDNEDMYQATCDAVGSKPLVTISWTLNGVARTDGNENAIDETNPTVTPPLSNTRSVLTFPATQENYGQTLVCQTTGHQLTELKRQESSDLNMHSSPSTAGTIATADYTTLGTDIRVTCTPRNEPTPPMRNYYIFSNGTLIHESMENVKEVTVLNPVAGTEFTCMAGNYLGNTSISAAIRYDSTATRTATPPPTTGM